MANLTTSADILDDALSRAGEATDGTSDLNSDAIVFLNRAYQGIWSGGAELEPSINETWWWLRKDTQGVLTLNPVITTDTVSVSNNSTTITFSSAPAASMAGRHFKVDDHADVFIILSHTGGNANATLESVYTGDDDTAASYKVFQLDYSLASDVLHLVSPMTAFQDNRYKIFGIDLEVLSDKWPLNEASHGVPTNFSMIGQRKVRFSHYGGQSSTELIKINYEYLYEPSDLADDATEPIVPRQYRKILSDWTLAFLLDKKEDTRAAGAVEAARRGLVAMAKENRNQMVRMSRLMGKIQPRYGQTDRFERPLRTESGLIIG